MYKYLESPDILTSEEYNHPQKLFLAGGITGVWDWQKIVSDALQDIDIIVMNPRRKNFKEFKNTSGFSESRNQIKWEHDHLLIANQILFWFSYETVQPITLFELGKTLTNVYWMREPFKPTIFVGAHPDYPRLFDIKVQIPLIDPNITVVEKIDDLILQVRNYNIMLNKLGNKNLLS